MPTREALTYAYRLQVALCSPSRTVLLTGLRPDSTKIWSIGPYFRDTMDTPGGRGGGQAVVTLPQMFRQAGYYTTGAGKIFHPGTSSGGPSRSEGGGDGGWPFRANGSWSKPYFFCDQFYNGTVQSPAMQQWPGARAARAGCIQTDECTTCLREAGSLEGKHSHKGAPCNASCYPDGLVADETIGQLHERARNQAQQPFFMAVGFKRPHLGWMAPQSFFDMYPPANVAVAKHVLPPPGMPKVAFSGNGEMCGMDDLNCFTNEDGFKLVPEKRHSELRAAYYAVVTFMDSQLGRVLDALEETRLRDSTAVVFWGDHGYQLGEHGLWCKVTNFELATRVPLVVSLPNQPTAGIPTRGFASLIDVFPTLLEVAGLPPNPANEGHSLLPLVKNPTEPTVLAKFNVSYSQFNRPGNIMGLSIRTDKLRFTRWAKFDTVAGRPEFPAPFDPSNTEVQYELYDHAGDTEADFDAFENFNLAANNTATVREMDAMLQRVWDGGKLNPALPQPPPPPSPPGPRYQYALTSERAAGTPSDVESTQCIGVGFSDTIELQPCPTMPTDDKAATEWVEVAADSKEISGKAHVQLESVKNDLCMNIYGGVSEGCKPGKRIHGNSCGGSHGGNWLAWDPITSSIRAAAGQSGCSEMCIGARTEGGGLVLEHCGGNSTRWQRSIVAT